MAGCKKKKIQDDASVSQYNGLKPKVIVEAGPPERGDVGTK